MAAKRENKKTLLIIHLLHKIHELCYPKVPRSSTSDNKEFRFNFVLEALSPDKRISAIEKDLFTRSTRKSRNNLIPYHNTF